MKQARGFAYFLDEVGKIYIPGSLDWYEKNGIDAWQANLDDLEKRVLIANGDWKEIERSVNASLESAKLLMKNFSMYGTKPKEITSRDAFIIGDPLLLSQVESTFYEKCVFCEDEKNLSMKENKKNGKVYLICNDELCLGRIKELEN